MLPQITGTLVELFVKAWGDGARWNSQPDDGPHEDSFLKLDNSRIKRIFRWASRWNLRITIDKVVGWTKTWCGGDDIRDCMNKQIIEFLGEENA